MKKIKLFLFAAAITGICSSFALTQKDPGDTYVKIGDLFYLKSGQMGECSTQATSACNYVLREGHSPAADSDFIFDTNDNSVWVPATP